MRINLSLIIAPNNIEKTACSKQRIMMKPYIYRDPPTPPSSWIIKINLLFYPMFDTLGRFTHYDHVPPNPTTTSEDTITHSGIDCFKPSSEWHTLRVRLSRQSSRHLRSYVGTYVMLETAFMGPTWLRSRSYVYLFKFLSCDTTNSTSQSETDPGTLPCHSKRHWYYY